MKSDPLDPVFAALGNATRRLILDELRARPGITIAAVAEKFKMSGVAALKHVRILEDAGLIVTEKIGRERHLHFNATPIQLIYDRWTNEYSQFWTARMADMKERIEARIAQRERAASPRNSTEKRKKYA